MHARDLIELAAFVAAEGSTLLRNVRRISPDAMAQYWTASKCRFDRWGRSLREFRRQQVLSTGSEDVCSAGVRAVCEEILTTEMLTRVWSCVVFSVEGKLGSTEGRPLIASVLAGHADATNRVLSLISLAELVPPRIAADLNRLRKITERWTDLVLARLGSPFGYYRLAHDSDRARDFADDFSQSQSLAAQSQAWALLTASLRATFAKRLGDETPNSDLNRRIAASIVACFPAETFDSVGVYHSLWQSRLSAMTSDTQVLVDELLDVERPRRFR